MKEALAQCGVPADAALPALVAPVRVLGALEAPAPELEMVPRPQSLHIEIIEDSCDARLDALTFAGTTVCFRCVRAGRHHMLLHSSPAAQRLRPHAIDVTVHAVMTFSRQRFRDAKELVVDPKPSINSHLIDTILGTPRSCSIWI